VAAGVARVRDRFALESAMTLTSRLSRAAATAAACLGLAAQVGCQGATAVNVGTTGSASGAINGAGVNGAAAGV
jgi:hypothetical protein